MHFLCQPVDLPTRVAEDDGLSDGQRFVQVTKSVQLPLFTLYANVKLPNTLQGELFFLDQDANGVPHEARGDLKHIGRHGSGKQDHLDFRSQRTENVVDLVLETARQHLVSLVEHEHLDVVDTEDTARNHVKHTAGGTCKDGQK